MNKNYVVRKANHLINAICRLDELEQKIISVIISEIKKDDKDFKDYVFKVSEFMDLLGIKDKSAYNDIPVIVEKLMSKTLRPQDANKIEIFHWISYFKYEKGTGEIIMQIHPGLKPYLLQLKDGNYTGYILRNILPMSSKYAIRIYEIIKSNEFKWQKEFTIDVEKLREILGIEETEYTLYADFKRKVILMAQREINAKTDILFEFEEIKKGRKVVSIKFIIYSKEKIKESAITAMDTEEEAIKEVTEIMEGQVNGKDAKNIYLKANKDLDKVREAYDVCKNKSIKNLTGYMIKLLSIEKIETPNPSKSKKKSNFDQRGWNYYKNKLPEE